VVKLTFGLIVLLVVSAIPATVLAQVPAGRWEIVHMTGDSSAQTNFFPGGFSTYLYSDGSGDGTDTASNSICIMSSYNVTPSWISLGGNSYQITFAVDNEGLGPNVTFIYTGAYSASTPVPGDLALLIPAITGTYYTTGDASACSTATMASPGTFIATFLPDLSSGSSSGSLDSGNTQGGQPFDNTVSTTITFSVPPSPGKLAGTVSLATNPTFNQNACFASTAGVPNALTINASLSSQVGILETIYAQGLDSQGSATTLLLQGYSANLYTTENNTDETANQLTSTEWAAGAAIGEDDPDLTETQGIGADGVSSDGTNNAIVVYYNVIGGVCDGAGGSDAPFHFLSGHPVPHQQHKPHRRSPVRRLPRVPDPRAAAPVSVRIRIN